MTTENKNNSAFPETGHSANETNGLTKREYALIHITASLATDIRANPKDVVKKAIEHVDEMFKNV